MCCCGVASWSGPTQPTLSAGAAGAYALVLNDAGAEASVTALLADGGSVTWDASDNEFTDAQITAYVHVMEAKRFAWGLDPDLGWLASQLEVTVNIT